MRCDEWFQFTTLFAHLLNIITSVAASRLALLEEKEFQYSEPVGGCTLEILTHFDKLNVLCDPAFPIVSARDEVIL